MLMKERRVEDFLSDSQVRAAWAQDMVFFAYQKKHFFFNKIMFIVMLKKVIERTLK